MQPRQNFILLHDTDKINFKKLVGRTSTKHRSQEMVKQNIDPPGVNRHSGTHSNPLTAFLRTRGSRDDKFHPSRGVLLVPIYIYKTRNMEVKRSSIDFNLGHLVLKVLLAP